MYYIWSVVNISIIGIDLGCVTNLVFSTPGRVNVNNLSTVRRFAVEEGGLKRPS